ncbi:MAG: hypothetical protein ABSA30_02950, partial [Candidatus Aminicenantales bacterium]
MRRMPAIILAVFLVLVLAQAPGLAAQDKDSNFSGSFQFGYRAVDTNENAPGYNKYKENIDLTSGIRLFNLSLTYQASEAMKKYFDRIDLSVVNLGGDPFESFSLNIQKFGTYKFRFDHRKSDYFYADMQTIGPGLFYDPRRLDFTRIQDSGEFNVTLGSHVNVFLTFDRYTKEGQDTTAYETNQASYVLTQPVSETMTETGFGLDLHVPRYSVLFEQRYQKYTSDNQTFLPTPAENGSGVADLDSFLQSLPYDFKTNVSTFRFTAHPFDNLLLKGSARLSDQKTSISYTEEAAGVDDLSAGYQYQLTGQGRFSQTMDLYDLDLNYLIFSKLAVVGAFRYDTFSQSGSFVVDDAP